MWAVSLCEALAICASYSEHPNPIARILFSYVSKESIGSTAIRISPSFLVSITFLVISAIIRTLCYRALGRLFTFQITIRPKHTLVTSGPYAWVRHPSYTGSILGFTGSVLCALSEGSWIRECGWLETWRGKAFCLFYLMWNIHVTLVMLWRTSQEDKMLKEKFGVEWVAWSRKVRYKLVPGIY